MIMKELATLPVSGRVAYAIICMEKFLLSKYPQKKWNILMEKMWEITNLRVWDKWLEEIMEYMPQYLFEFTDYESSGFEYISIKKYNELVDLYDGVDNDVNLMLNMIFELVSLDIEKPLDGNDKEDMGILKSIIAYLEEFKILFPSVDTVKIFLKKQNCEDGMPFEGKKLSALLFS